MPRITRLLLDVLKPHNPNAIDFCKRLAECGDYRISLSVVEVDEKTETIQVEILGESIDAERIQSAISDMGASLHSIDAVNAINTSADQNTA